MDDVDLQVLRQIVAGHAAGHAMAILAQMKAVHHGYRIPAPQRVGPSELASSPT